MASDTEGDAAGQMSYKEALIDGEPAAEQPQEHSDFHPDPSILSDSQPQHKGESKGAAGKEDGDGEHNLKSSLLITGVVMAAVGVIIALVKKIKQQP